MSMNNKILHKRSDVAAKEPLPGDLELGELAINTTDGKVFMKKTDNSVTTVGSTGQDGLGRTLLIKDISGTVVWGNE